MAFAIKAAITALPTGPLAFSSQKTMYDGKQIAQGDTIFIFASENEGGAGLIASGVVTSAKTGRKEKEAGAADAARQYHSEMHGSREATSGAKGAQTLF